MLKPIKIVDIIHHKNKYTTQEMLVLDRMPVFLYERKGRYLIAEDSGFFNFYGYEACSPGWEAFGGSKFDIPLIDGTIIKAFGQWWDSMPKDYRGLLCSPGISTADRLAKCNVFNGGNVDPEIRDAWLANNEPSNNYHRYDSRHKDFGKHTIVSQWEIICTIQQETQGEESARR